MTQAQLNSTAKRVNTALVQYEKTFGVNSEAYQRYQEQIINAVGVNNVHITKSGHIAINTGKGLIGKEAQLQQLDAPSNKVRGRMKEAENILQEEFKEQNPGITPPKFTKSQIKAKVEQTAGFENFFNTDIGELYALRKESPELDYLLSLLEEKRGYKLSYTQLNDIITRCLEIRNELRNREPNILTTEQLAEQRSKRGFI